MFVLINPEGKYWNSKTRFSKCGCWREEINNAQIFTAKHKLRQSFRTATPSFKEAFDFPSPSKQPWTEELKQQIKEFWKKYDSLTTDEYIQFLEKDGYKIKEIQLK